MKNKDKYCFSGNRHFGEWLEMRMDRKGVTLLEVAKGSKLSYFRLQNIKDRKTGVRIDMAAALAEYFKISLGKMFNELKLGGERRAG